MQAFEGIVMKTVLSPVLAVSFLVVVSAGAKETDSNPVPVEEKAYTCVAWPKFQTTSTSLLPGQGWGTTRLKAAAEAIENCLVRNRTTLSACHVTKKDCSKIVKPKQVI